MRHLLTIGTYSTIQRSVPDTVSYVLRVFSSCRRAMLTLMKTRVRVYAISCVMRRSCCLSSHKKNSLGKPCRHSPFSCSPQVKSLPSEGSVTYKRPVRWPLRYGDLVLAKPTTPPWRASPGSRLPPMCATCLLLSRWRSRSISPCAWKSAPLTCTSYQTFSSIAACAL
jgi:hypothetical protein